MDRTPSTLLPPLSDRRDDLDAEAVRWVVRERFPGFDADTLYVAADFLLHLSRGTDDLEAQAEGYGVKPRFLRQLRTIGMDLHTLWDDRQCVRLGMLKAFAVARLAREEAGGLDAEIAQHRAERRSERAGEHQLVQELLDAAAEPEAESAVHMIVPGDDDGPAVLLVDVLAGDEEVLASLRVQDHGDGDRPLTEAARMLAEQLALRGVRVHEAHPTPGTFASHFANG